MATKYTYVLDNEQAYNTFAKAHEVVVKRAVEKYGMVIYDEKKHKRLTDGELDVAKVICAYKSKVSKTIAPDFSEQMCKTTYYTDGSVIYSYPIID